MIRYYVRVSTIEQKLDRQLLAYTEADVVYKDKFSGKTKDRPSLKKLLEDLQEGDIVVVKSLDRLSRSTLDLLDIVEEIERKKASIKILDTNIDTSGPMGRFFITLLGAVAELERANIRQRQLEGIAIAKEKGIYRGRKPGSISINGESLQRFKKFYKLGMNKTDLSKEFGVPRATIYNWIKTLKERGEIS